MIQISLFISNFKKFGKRIAGVLLLMICIIFIYKFMEYLLVEPNEWARVIWHNYYNEDDNIDNLFIGSSHVYQTVNPYLLDEMTGENNFNLATGNMPLNGAYYVLKEADRDHELKHVYIEMYFLTQSGKYGLKEEVVSRNWRNTDYMKLSRNRIDYILDMCKKEQYIDSFFPLIRYRSHVFDSEHIGNVLATKEAEEYKNFQYKSNDGLAYEKGFLYCEPTFPVEDWRYTQYFLDENPLGEDAEKYLYKIIQYCKDNDIALTLFTAPTTELQLGALNNYDYYVRQISSIADENEIPYYDFNLCRSEYLKLEQEKHFYNNNHLNGKGANVFTQLLGKVMLQDSSENEKYFYSSYEEKMDLEKSRVYGISKLDEKIAEEKGFNYTIVNNSKGELEYKIILWDEMGNQLLVQEFSDNALFSVMEGCSICQVQVREKKNGKILQDLRIKLPS